jgi:hypothetical protein
LTLQRVASGFAIIAGFFTVLVVFTLNDNIRINANLRIFVGIAIQLFMISMVVVFIIIPYLRSSEKFKSFRIRVSRKTKIQFTTKPSVFNAEIVNKKQAYLRGVDSVSFRSRFIGNLTNGYFMTKISAQSPTGVHDVSAYLFYYHTPDIGSNRRYIVLYHPKTANIWHETIGKKVVGKLNGEVDTEWLYLDWKIPDDVRLGRYVIEMTVVNNPDGYMPIKDTFNVIDPDDSHYRRFNRINID